MHTPCLVHACPPFASDRQDMYCLDLGIPVYSKGCFRPRRVVRLPCFHQCTTCTAFPHRKGTSGGERNTVSRWHKGAPPQHLRGPCATPEGLQTPPGVPGGVWRPCATPEGLDCETGIPINSKIYSRGAPSCFDLRSEDEEDEEDEEEGLEGKLLQGVEASMCS